MCCAHQGQFLMSNFVSAGDTWLSKGSEPVAEQAGCLCRGHQFAQMIHAPVDGETNYIVDISR